MPFNPDEYLATKTGGFDPDKYLAGKDLPVEPKQIEEGNIVDAFVEPAIAMATGLAGSVVGGLSAIGTHISTGSPEQAAEVAESTLQSFNEIGAPETKAGQEGLELVGNTMQSVMDFASEQTMPLAAIVELVSGNSPAQAKETMQSIKDKGFTETAANRVLEETRSPLLATVAKMSPDIIGSVFALGKIVKSNRAGSSFVGASKINPDIKNPFTPSTVTQQKIADQLAKGGTDSALAKYITSGAGKVKTDKLAISAIKQGFEPGVIAAVKGASKADRVKMLRMVNIMERGKKNALFQMKNRPSDIAGDSLLKRIQHVRTVNRTAGKQIDKVAKSLKGKKVDFSDPIDNFANNLEDMGISLSDDLKPIFKGSDIEGLKAPENAINNIVKRLASGTRGKAPDAHDLHRMKRFIDEVVTYGKSGEGLSGKTERILKKLRSDIDNSLDRAFPEYDKVNSTYAETIGALDNIQSAAGTKMNLAGKNADKAVGTLLRRLMSNVQSRVNLIDAVDDIEKISKKFGSSFDDDIATQMLFADELDSVFGAVARTSLQGEIGKGVKNSLDTAVGNKTATGVAIDATAKVADKLRGINEKNAFKSINELLKRD